MQRITVKDLRPLVERMNRATGRPEGEADWTRIETAEGPRNVATVGRYVLDGAYGGWMVYQLDNEGGGVREVYGTPYGHVPARELYSALHAWLGGFEVGEARHAPTG